MWVCEGGGVRARVRSARRVGYGCGEDGGWGGAGGTDLKHTVS
jgi:hypothetical protein